MEPTHAPKSFGPPGRCDDNEQAAVNRATHRWGMDYRANVGVTKRYCWTAAVSPEAPKRPGPAPRLDTHPAVGLVSTM